MRFEKIRVVFDDGHDVEVQLKSRDVAKAERLGIDLNTTSEVVGSYALVFVALQRMKRTGEIDFDLPKDAEALEDVADLDTIEVVEGEGSGQEAATG